jgi:hypothetical protein
VYSPPGDKYELFIEGANHLTHGSRLAPKEMTYLVKIAGTAFGNQALTFSKK